MANKDSDIINEPQPKLHKFYCKKCNKFILEAVATALVLCPKCKRWVSSKD